MKIAVACIALPALVAAVIVPGSADTMDKSQVPLQWYVQMLKSMDATDVASSGGKPIYKSAMDMLSMPSATSLLSESPASSVLSSLPTANFMSNFSGDKTPQSSDKTPEFLPPFDPLQAKIDLLTLLSQGIEEKTGGLLNPKDLKNIFLPGGSGGATGFGAFNKTFGDASFSGAGGFNKNFTNGANGLARITPAGFQKFLDFFSSDARFTLFKQFFAADSIAATKFLNLLFVNGS